MKEWLKDIWLMLKIPFVALKDTLTFHRELDKLTMKIVNTKEYKTSQDWHRKYMKETKMCISDPDGWDRSGDFHYSWYIERITQDEFFKRAAVSTHIPASEYSGWYERS